MRAVLVVSLATLALLGGCAAKAPGVVQDASGVPEVSGTAVNPPLNFSVVEDNPAFEIPFSAERCKGGQAWLDVNPGLLQSALPPGYVAGDAQDLAGPRWTGRALASVETFVCEENALGPGPLAFGLFAVYIEPPAAGAELEAIDTNWYQFMLFTPNKSLLGLLAPTGTIVGEGKVTNAVSSIPNGVATSDGEAHDDRGAVFTFQAVSALADRQADFTRRLWHDTGRGILHVDYAVTSDLVQGTARCSNRQGSIVQDVTKIGECTPDRVQAGWVWGDTRWDASIRYVPVPECAQAESEPVRHCRG